MFPKTPSGFIVIVWRLFPPGINRAPKPRRSSLILVPDALVDPCRVSSTKVCFRRREPVARKSCNTRRCVNGFDLAFPGDSISRSCVDERKTLDITDATGMQTADYSGRLLVKVFRQSCTHLHIELYDTQRRGEPSGI